MDDIDECPKWLKDSVTKSRTQESTAINESEQPDYEMDEQFGSENERRAEDLMFERDDEMDPND